jgi:hypothetical protein
MSKKRKPYNKSTGRDYDSDYEKFQSSPKAKKDRAARNAARRKLEKAGKVRKGDGKDVAHRNSNPRDNSSKNLSVSSIKANRGKAGEGGRKRKKRK